jgi:hypothetical protein
MIAVGDIIFPMGSGCVFSCFDRSIARDLIITDPKLVGFVIAVEDRFGEIAVHVLTRGMIGIVWARNWHKVSHST